MRINVLQIGLHSLPNPKCQPDLAGFHLLVVENSGSVSDFGNLTNHGATDKESLQLSNEKKLMSKVVGLGCS